MKTFGVEVEVRASLYKNMYQPSQHPICVYGGAGDKLRNLNQPSYSATSFGGLSGLFDPYSDHYIISALDRDYVLDISMGNNSSRYQAILWNRNGGANQTFRFKEVAMGRYQIVSGVGAVLEVPHNSHENGTQLVAGPINNAINE